MPHGHIDFSSHSCIGERSHTTEKLGMVDRSPSSDQRSPAERNVAGGGGGYFNEREQPQFWVLMRAVNRQLPVAPMARPEDGAED